MKIIEFLKWVYWDIKHPRPTRPYGIEVYVGLPGSGKTLALSERLLDARNMYPKAKIYTNFGFKFEDGKLDNWEQLLQLDNGTDGIIFGLDEVHLMFGRDSWKKAPPDILHLFSQNRKFAKALWCTSQAFGDVSIDLRRRTSIVWSVRNFRNRWIRMKGYLTGDYEDMMNPEGQKKERFIKKDSFIASNEIYDSYDSFAIIDNIMKQSVKPKELPEGQSSANDLII